jgi:N6-adenosine-specific RNA methylase IME4
MDGGEVAASSKFMVTVDDAMRAQAEANTPDELVRFADTAEALRVYARRARLGLSAQNRACELRLRAERRIGEYLSGTDRHVGGRPPEKPVRHANRFSPLRLGDLGIDRKLSFRAQRIAAIPTSTFDSWLQNTRTRGVEIVTRDLLNLNDRREAAARNRRRIVGGGVTDLIEFARAGNRMGTLYIDPPWRFSGTVVPYETIDLDQLCEMPIPMLAAERCHLHMWATGINHQFAAKEVIETWGFRVVGDFVWVKPSLGGRNYWRQSHEVLLTAVRGDAPDRFDDHGLRSWIEAPRAGHSEKPEVVRGLIERASPGPRLEIFGRKLAQGWFVWGHEISTPLSEQG